MSWKHYSLKHYEYWNYDSATSLPAVYRFKHDFWIYTGVHDFLHQGIQWQYTLGDGKWHVMPEGLETLEDKQAYVYTLYRLEGHDGNS